MESGFDRPIFVTGVPRSGTSIIAGALGIGGAWLGRTVPGNQYNRRGFFEHSMIREKVVKSLLQRLHCDPLGVQRLPAFAQLPQVNNLRSICRSLLEAEGYSDSGRWLYKDAKLSLLWPLFADAFSGAHWVIVRRNSDDIVRSCIRADFMAQHSLDECLWFKWIEQYNLRLEMLLNSEYDCSEIWPQHLIRGDFSALERLITRMGLNWDEKRISEFILPGEWHASS